MKNGKISSLNDLKNFLDNYKDKNIATQFKQDLLFIDLAFYYNYNFEYLPAAYQYLASDFEFLDLFLSLFH